METIICYTGGEAQGNPGAAAIGVYIVDGNGVVVTEISKTIGNASADFAEYYGVMVGLQTLQALYGDETKTMNFELRLSSELVKKQLNAEMAINEPGLVPMFIEIHNMRVASFPNLLVTQVIREQNIALERLFDKVLDVK